MYKVGDIVILFNPNDNRTGYIKNITRHRGFRYFDIVEFSNGKEHALLSIDNFCHYEDISDLLT